MMYIVIGNIVALIASILMLCSGFVKKKNIIVIMQTIQMALATLGNIILGGFTGAIINTISCVRNILCYKDKLGLKEKIIITVLSVIFTIKFNTAGLLGLLPLIGTVPYVWLKNTKDVIKFKLLLIYSSFIWFVYEISIISYTSAIFNLGNMIANLISIFLISRKCNIK